MGAGVLVPSNPSRLRKALVMRAYNVRKEQCMKNGEDWDTYTLEDQFFPYQDSNQRISITSIRRCLALDSSQSSADSNSWFDGLIKSVLQNSINENNEIRFRDFIQFLETGQISTDSNSSICNIESSDTTDITTENDDNPTMKLMSKSRNSSKSDLLKDQQSMVPFQPRDIALSSKDAYRQPFQEYTKQNMWKKREIVKQERIVEYTTVDDNGEVQELVENEIHQSEILHMEVRETGEYAHREITHFEHTEKFNNEFVSVKQGTEEYVHLKSKDDEYEFAESTMPKKEEEALPESPLPENESHNPELFMNMDNLNTQGSIDNTYDYRNPQFHEDLHDDIDDGEFAAYTEEELKAQFRLEQLEMESDDGDDMTDSDQVYDKETEPIAM